MYNAYNAQEPMRPQPRQRPGSACEECRRRKLRCDGKQPQCQHCSETGVQCITIHSRSQRGPKRGHMKALQTRMGTFGPSALTVRTVRLIRSVPATLEQRLLEQQQNGSVLSLPRADLPCSSALEIPSMDAAIDLDPSLTLSNLPDHTLVNLPDPISENYQLDVSLGTVTPESLDSTVGIHLSSLLRTDLYVDVWLSPFNRGLPSAGINPTLKDRIHSSPSYINASIFLGPNYPSRRSPRCAYNMRCGL